MTKHLTTLALKSRSKRNPKGYQGPIEYIVAMDTFKSNENSPGISTKHKDIDGGYAWIILFAAFVSGGIGNGYFSVFAILYVEILERYQAGKYLTSWIITIQLTAYGVIGKKAV